MLFKRKYFPIAITFIITFTLLNCSFFPTQYANKSDPSVPMPGTAVEAAGTGSTVAVTWGQATDDNGAEWLVYKVVRSESPVEDVNTAELLPNVVQNYSEYSGETVYDTGVSPGIYYYNVIVKDEHDNRALYTGDSAEAVLDNTPPVPGSGITAQGAGTTVKITWEQADDDSLPVGLEYRLVRSDAAISTIAQAEAVAGSGIVRDYDEYGTGVLYDIGCAIGMHYYNIIAKDASGNKALYICDSAETTIDDIEPIPGNGVYATQKGGTVEITWEEGDDNSLPAGLVYKAVRSMSSIDTLGEADAATVIQDYAFYDGEGAIDEDLYEEGIYYYNVIVSDASNNRSLYVCDSVNITINTVSGMITLPGSTVEIVKAIIDNDSNYENGYTRSVSAVKQSGLQYTYTLDRIYKGSYYVYARVDNDPYGTSLGPGDFTGYYGSTGMNPPSNANLKVTSSDEESINISLTEIPASNLYSVSGRIRAPVYIKSGTYYIAFDIDGDVNTTGDWYLASGEWPSNNRDAEYKINCVPPGTYWVFVFVTEYPDTFYMYQSSSANLTVTNTDLTGKNFIVAKY